MAKNDKNAEALEPIGLDKRASQDILDLFTNAFHETLSKNNELQTQIQAVKGALYDRDYAQAFGSIENLNAYVVRWSPSRALGYSALFRSLEPIRQIFETKSNVRVLTIGGGAGAEIVSLGSIALQTASIPAKVDVLAVDIAEWDPVIGKIVEYIADKWYAGATELQSLEDKIAAMSLNDSKFRVNFINHDILTLPQERLNLESVDLITSMFTTNELFALSKAGTVKFLQSLRACRKGTLLLLVESAGSYSQIQVGSKVFPVQFLIDHSLTSDGSWTLLEGTDSRWFRLEDKLFYDLKLENMRFFYRLYQRN
uniref:ARAD1C27654p n=1 Tax=Blastobotrys adeninivorans TaxID=409370 RepID=A0A060T2C0_BLAAD